MPTVSYAPFQNVFVRRVRESKTTCIIESEFGVGGWRKSHGVGIGVEVSEILEILLI